MTKTDAMLRVLLDSLVEQLNALHREISRIKEERPDLRTAFSMAPGPVLNAYREGDVSYSEAVEILTDNPQA